LAPIGFSSTPVDHLEPPHVHVQRERFTAKFWLSPVRLEYSKGFPPQEIGRLQRLIVENQEKLLEEWNEYFSN
jgi:hypothetical protein